YSGGPAASMAVEEGLFELNNADIYGYISVGTTTGDAGLDLGPNGTVGDFGAKQGTIDYDRATPNFTANPQDRTNPPVPLGTPIVPLINATIEFPRAEDIAFGTQTTKEEGTAYYVKVGKIDLNNAQLRVTGTTKVVLIVTAPAGTEGIKLAGSSTTTIRVET